MIRDTHTVKILVFNCGSSSLKYKIIRMPEEEELVAGEAERVGIKTQDTPCITHWARGKKRVVRKELPDHNAACMEALALIQEDHAQDEAVGFDAVAHRYVHPGRFFSKTTRVTKSVVHTLKKTLALAPIHNPTAYQLVALCAREFPKTPQYVVFDTAFHASIAPEFSTYALPRALTKKYGIRKVGFHGISHNYVMLQACRALARDVKTQKIISCHLGTGGSSVCAIEYGKSVNNSMGFTPLEGLVMNTRSGALDMGLVFYIMFNEKFSGEQAEAILNKKSGVLGVFQSSSDLRDVEKNIASHDKAKMAFSMYVRRVKKYIGYYNLLLKKADILVFTDSIGAGMPLVREKVCDGLKCFGICIDKEKNNHYAKGVEDISAPESKTRILVVPTDEEIMISRETYKELCHDTGSRP